MPEPDPKAPVQLTDTGSAFDDAKNPAGASARPGLINMDNFDPDMTKPALGGNSGDQQRPEQERQRAVMDGQGLSDLEEPDQLEPVQALGAGLVAVDFGSRA